LSAENNTLVFLPTEFSISFGYLRRW